MPELAPGAYSFERLASFENLFAAARKAERGKRFTHAAAVFNQRLAENLMPLRGELLSGSYRPGEYRTFQIFEPTHRHISAAPYRDRVVHHALCNVMAPLFERSFIADSYANRIGKGTHRALDRCTEYVRRYSHVFQGDIRQFFPAIDHRVLAARLARRIHDPRVLGLANLILDSSNEQEPAIFYFPGDDLFSPHDRRRGLPIGNLTSQFWANVYLDPLDHFFRDQLGAPGYIRYVDDFLVFSNDANRLAEWRSEAGPFLDGLRLLLHPRKSRIYPTAEGIPFLGFRVYPAQRRMLAGGVQRARRRLTRQASEYAAGEVDRGHVARSVRSWIAHAMHGDTTGLRRTLPGALVLRARRAELRVGDRPGPPMAARAVSSPPNGLRTLRRDSPEPRASSKRGTGYRPRHEDDFSGFHRPSPARESS